MSIIVAYGNTVVRLQGNRTLLRTKLSEANSMSHTVLPDLEHVPLFKLIKQLQSLNPADKMLAGGHCMGKSTLLHAAAWAA